MKKIAFYIYSLNRGGAERVLLALIEYLKEKYQIVLITDAIEKCEYTLPEGIHRINIGTCTYKGIFRKLSPIWRLRQLQAIVKKEKADVLVAFMLQNGVRALMAHVFSNQRIIAAVRSDPAWEYPTKWKRMWLNAWMSKADKVVCQTGMQRDFFCKSVQRKTTLIANAVREDFPYALPYEQRQKKIVSSGRLVDYKNHLMLIKAFERAKEYLKDYRVYIYGEGPYRDVLEQYLEEHSLTNQVFLPGDVEDVAGHIQDAELFVLPSNTEGMPNALMEAMQMGIAVISTDCPCGGPRSLLENGKNGYLCEVNNDEQLAQIMCMLLKDKKRLQEVGNEALTIRETHCPKEIYGAWEKLLFN